MDDAESVTSEKGEQIFRAAVAEFRESGFSGASMDRISARAGASKRTVYKHFSSKEKLFHELMRRHWATFQKGLHVHYEPGRDIRDQLMSLGHAAGKMLTCPDAMATTRMVMSEVLRSPDLVEENQQKTNYTTAVAEMLRHAAMDRQLQIDDPQVAAEEFIVLLKGKAFWPVIFGAPVVTAAEMDKIVQSSVEIMMCRYGV